MPVQEFEQNLPPAILVPLHGPHSHHLFSLSDMVCVWLLPVNMGIKPLES